MKKRLFALLCVVTMTAGILAGCSGGSKEGPENKQEAGSAEKTDEGTSADQESVVVTMPTTSEPESGFDPAYGWGAGEHVHEPLIQSTLTTTTKDLKIDKDLATDYTVSEDGLT